MTTYLKDAQGFSYVTLSAERAEWCVEPLGDFLGCIVRTVPVTKAGIGYENVEADWHLVVVPAKLHVAARSWLAGWQRGQRDHSDRMYGRPRSPTMREHIAAEAVIEGLVTLASRAS